MATITYTPSREVVGGGGSIVCDVEQWDRSSKPVGKEFTSLNGTTVHTLDRIETEINISCEPQDASGIAYFREFAASCANGETFTINANGVPGAPTVTTTYRLKRGSYKESRMSTHIKPSFTVEAV